MRSMSELGVCMLYNYVEHMVLLVDLPASVADEIERIRFNYSMT